MKRVILIILALGIIGGAGYAGWKHYSRKNINSSNQNSQNQQNNSDPYAGWKTGESPRAGFNIKYPSDWTFNLAVGNKDNVEHITIDSSHFHITIDSYLGNDVSSGGQSSTKCPDCSETINSSEFTINRLGKANLMTITYELDNGSGNALIIELADSTYFIKSPIKTNVSTSFRGTSVLDSEKAYQQESKNQFLLNLDYETAKKIMKSVTY
jgi:hypothetical protein